MRKEKMTRKRRINWKESSRKHPMWKDELSLKKRSNSHLQDTLRETEYEAVTTL